MKGLAIASFVLGIIGFLLSFIFGLGIMASILAVIFGIIPLTKKVEKQMAILGLILGILGTLISISFLIQKPEDIIEKTIKEIAKEEEARPSKNMINLGEGIKIISTAYYCSPKDSEQTIIIGILKNESSKAIEQINLELTFFDKEGKVIEKRRKDILYNIPSWSIYPGETIPFQIAFGGMLEEIPKDISDYKINLLKMKAIDKGLRAWDKKDLSLKWSNKVITYSSLASKEYYILKGEIENKGKKDVPYGELRLRIYGFDKKGNLIFADMEGVKDIPAGESTLFEFALGYPGQKIDSYKVELK